MSKIALITGGSRGLGRDMALRLAEKGNDIIITYNSKKEEAEAVIAQAEKMGRKGVALQLNVGDIKSFDGFIDQVKEVLKSKWGVDKFDFLINNAGYGVTLTIAEITEEAFDDMVNVHFKGVYFLTQKALPVINDNGSIINLSSGTTQRGVPGYSAYASCKSAVETFTKYLAREVGARGITANVLAPGPIATDFNGGRVRDNVQFNTMLSTQAALGRVGRAEDIGGIVAFLCSDDAHWINGQRIEASGGINL